LRYFLWIKFGGDFFIKELKINEKIKAREIRVIDDEGNQLGIMTVFDALKMAEEKTQDLVEVSPNTEPPVCKIMDYGKYRYEQKKKDKVAKQKRKTQELKEVTLRPKIDDHDYVVKSKTVQRIINEGDKVKVSIRFRGRETMYTQFAEKIMDNLKKDSESIATVEREPKLEGKNMIMILVPKETK